MASVLSPVAARMYALWLTYISNMICWRFVETNCLIAGDWSTSEMVGQSRTNVYKQMLVTQSKQVLLSSHRSERGGGVIELSSYA